MTNFRGRPPLGAKEPYGNERRRWMASRELREREIRDVWTRENVREEILFFLIYFL